MVTTTPTKRSKAPDAALPKKQTKQKRTFKKGKSSTQITAPFKAVTEKDIKRAEKQAKAEGTQKPLTKKASLKQAAKQSKADQKERVKDRAKKTKLDAREKAKAQKVKEKEEKREIREFRRKRILVFSGFAMLILILACIMIYPVAQEWYKTLRENQRLEAQYNVLAALNEDTQEHIDGLNTDDGIENQAREYGWVKEGENAVTVVNAGESSETATASDPVDLEEIEAPQTWLTDIFDAVFQVEE